MSFRKLHKNRIMMFQFLVEIMRDKPFGLITVDEIIEKSMISRVTFYRHVSNKWQLLSFGISYFAGEVVEHMGILESWETDAVRHVVDTFFTFLDKRESLLLPLLGPHSPREAKRQFSGIVGLYLENCIFHCGLCNPFRINRVFLVSVVKNIILDIIRKWPSLSIQQRQNRIRSFYNFIFRGTEGLFHSLPAPM